MTIYVTDKENGITTALNLDSITYDEKTNTCTFETIRGKKGKIITHTKKAKNNLFVYNAFNNTSAYGEIIWEE